MAERNTVYLVILLAIVILGALAFVNLGEVPSQPKDKTTATLKVNVVPAKNTQTVKVSLNVVPREGG